jgi:hypothetical protein
MRSLLSGFFVAVVATSAFGQGYTPQGYMPQGYGAAAAAPSAGAGLAPTATPYYGGDTGYAGNTGYVPANYGAVAPGVASSLLSYGLLEGFYQYTTFEDTLLDASHGLGLSLTAELFQPFFIRGAFGWSGGNGKGVPDGYSFSTAQIGGGGYFAVTDRFHVVGEVGGIYASLTADESALSFSDGALYIRPGVRFAATESLELQAAIMATSADDYNTRVYDIGAFYRLFTQMDIGLGAGFGDAQTGYRAGVRFRW